MAIPAERPMWFKWARILFTGASIIGTGVLLFKYTVPTDEELIARFSPEVRADYERNKALRRKEQEELMKIVQKTAASNDPIWKTDQIKSPLERDGRGIDPKLVDKELFHKQSGDDFKKSAIEKANLELQEAEQLVKQQGKRHWWSWK